jgi:hypothetical protein
VPAEAALRGADVDRRDDLAAPVVHGRRHTDHSGLELLVDGGVTALADAADLGEEALHVGHEQAPGRRRRRLHDGLAAVGGG